MMIETAWGVMPHTSSHQGDQHEGDAHSGRDDDPGSMLVVAHGRKGCMLS